MGEQNIDDRLDGELRQRFLKSLLDDVRALELLLERGMIESGVRRIGAEQEVFLVDQHWHPAPRSMEVLQELDDPDFTTELARFNLEFNIAPLEFGGDCLRQLERELNSHLEKLRQAAQRIGIKVVMTGILPTLTKSDLGIQNMSPMPRYRALNDALMRLRGEDYAFRIEGIEDLILSHDSVMLEACNTSFQVHFQVGPDEFARLYNVAQLVTAPLLASCTNSPLLFGRRLWRETRIALFQQSVDTRQATSNLRESRARVSFGNSWIERSVLEIFKEDIARFKVVIAAQNDEDPLKLVEGKRPPRLNSLRLHNGTVYRWNRPCYGLHEGKAHIRIENRVIPAGPSIPDAVANAAFFFGLMSGVSKEYQDVSALIDFGEVNSNFLAAARSGLGAQFTWLNGKPVPAQQLICSELLPLAREGLKNRNLDSSDIDRYLGIVQERVETRKTGSQWLLDSLSGMKRGGKVEKLAALVAATAERQSRDLPVHRWDLARVHEAGGWRPNYQRVEQFMTTDLFTVTEEDTVDLVANLMNWERIRHIPVEDVRHRLVGLISYRSLLKFYGSQYNRTDADALTVPVTRIMKANPITVPPETTIREAMRIMRENRIGCLPVVKEGKLVGVVTERDFMNLATDLLETQLEND